MKSNFIFQLISFPLLFSLVYTQKGSMLVCIIWIIDNVIGRK